MAEFAGCPAPHRSSSFIFMQTCHCECTLWPSTKRLHLAGPAYVVISTEERLISWFWDTLKGGTLNQQCLLMCCLSRRPSTSDCCRPTPAAAAAAGYRVKGVNEAVEAEKSIKLSKLPQVSTHRVPGWKAAQGIARCMAVQCSGMGVNLD